MKHTVFQLAAMLCAATVCLADGDASRPVTGRVPVIPAMQAARPAANPLAPTLADVAYGPHPKQIMHFWQAKADKPTPLLLFIHGGGWVQGDRMSGLGALLRPMLDAGISVASVEYRFIADAMRDGVSPPVKAPMEDGARALQFIRSKAAEWNIDKTRIAASGGSAGACTSLWLAFHDDMADPSAAHPIARESTRLLFAAVTNPQTSLDPKQMKQWIPNSTYGSHAFGIIRKINDDPAVAEPRRFAMDFEAFLARREELLPLINTYSPYALVTADDPPVYLHFPAAPAMGKPQKDPTHSANFGVKLQERCKEAGVPCELVYPGAPGVLHLTVKDALIARLKPSAKPAAGLQAPKNANAKP